MRIFLYRNALALVAAGASTAVGQSRAVPGRDLLSFPIGLVVEAAALPGLLGVGHFNPAASRLDADSAWRIAVGAMSTPSDLAAGAQVGGVSRAWRGMTLTASLVRAAVAGILRTESDPLTVGSDVPYATQVLSLGMAARRGAHVTVGGALRLRSGQLDFERRTAPAFDVGIVAERLTSFDARVGAASYLWSPFSRGEATPTLHVAGDLRLVGRDTARTIRAGAALSRAAAAASEQFWFGSARLDAWELRGGAVRTTAHGDANIRTRLGIGVHYGAYVVGLAREGMPSGIAPTYQFVLSTVVR